MGIYEPCQVGNKAALSRTFHVPWASRVELLSEPRIVRSLYLVTFFKSVLWMSFAPTSSRKDFPWTISLQPKFSYIHKCRTVPSVPGTVMPTVYPDSLAIADRLQNYLLPELHFISGKNPAFRDKTAAEPCFFRAAIWAVCTVRTIISPMVHSARR